MGLVELYEQKHYKIEAPDPIEAIKFRMEQMNMKRVDMPKYFGTRGRVSEILNRQRKLTFAMIRNYTRNSVSQQNRYWHNQGINHYFLLQQSCTCAWSEETFGLR